MSEINELVTRFSFVGSLKPQETFNKGLKASIGLVAGVGAAMAAGTAVVGMWASSVTQALDPTIQLSRTTGEAVGEMQALGFAASQNGSDLQAVRSSVSELNKRLGEYARTGAGPAAEAAHQYGLRLIDANGKARSSIAVMKDLNKTMQGMSAARQADLLDKLGIDESMIQTLRMSDGEMSKLLEKAEALGTLNKEQADAAAELTDANTVMRFGLESLQNQLAVGVAPAISDVVSGFTDFLIANKDLIQNGIKKLGEVLKAFIGTTKRMLPLITTLVGAFAAYKAVMFVVAVATGAATAPISLMVAGVMAAILVVDDLLVALKGGDSVIKDFFDELGIDIMPALQATADSVEWLISTMKANFKEATSAIGNIFSGLWKLVTGDFDGAISDWKAAFKNLGNILKNTFNEPLKFITDKFEKFVTKISKKMTNVFDDVVESVKGILSGVFEPFMKGVNKVLSAVGLGGDDDEEKKPVKVTPREEIERASAQSSYAPRAMMSSNSPKSMSNNVNQQNQFYIYSNNPEQAGNAVGDKINQQARDARVYYGRGGM